MIGVPQPPASSSATISAVFAPVPQRDALVYVDGFAAESSTIRRGFQQLTAGARPPRNSCVPQDIVPCVKSLFESSSTHTIKHTLVPLGPGEAGEPQPVPRAMPPRPGGPAPLPPGAEAPRGGTLALRVQPGDASVYIDGELWRGPQGQDRLVIQLTEGSHRVRVENAGFQSFEVQVDVRAGETTGLNGSLVSVDLTYTSAR